MIIAKNPRRLNSRWLQACVLLCAVVVLPFGVVYAQDYEAVGKRLRAAVAAGEVTGEQAGAMLGTLRKSGAKKDQDPDRAKAYLAKVRKELGAAVKAGKMSEEDAHRKIDAIKKEVLAKIQRHHKSDRESAEVYVREVWEKLQAAVKAGKMSEGDRERGSPREEVARRLKEAVAAGKLSEEDARAKWEAFKREMEGRHDERREGDEEHQHVKRLPDEVAHKIAGALLKAAAVDFEGAAAKAVGVFADDEGKHRGMILVPAKAFTDEEKAPELAAGDSALLALLFTSPSIVLVGVDRDKMHSVTVTGDGGKEHQSNYMMLIVKRISEEEYHVYGMGDSAKALIDTRVTEGEGPGEGPFAMEVKNIDEESKTAEVVITVFNKYQAGFRAGVAE